MTARLVKLTLLSISIAWAALAGAYVAVAASSADDDGHAWPIVVTVLFAVASVLVLAFYVGCHSRRLYDLAGGISVVAITARAMSLVNASLHQDDTLAAIALSVAQVVVTILLLALFWWFWQIQVKLWHRERME